MLLITYSGYIFHQGEEQLWNLADVGGQIHFDIKKMKNLSQTKIGYSLNFLNERWSKRQQQQNCVTISG